MVQVQISKKQAQIFAQAIFADIDTYIENHKEEYEFFLKEEEKTAQLGGMENETD